MNYINNFLTIDPHQETKRITEFIQNTLNKTGFNKIVIGLSGGVDSATSLLLLKKAAEPNNIIAVNLPYFDAHENILEANKTINIKDMVDDFKKKLKVNHDIRLGNIMARVRMTVLYDFAKKNKALVCGTENKSEYLLGYFTRFGDEASDFEPIRHLYKTQIYELAKYLKMPQKIIDKKPSAGLWSGQNDELELGFTYKQADPVLYLYFEKKLTVGEIEAQGCAKAKQIIETALKNKFKHEVPYHL